MIEGEVHGGFIFFLFTKLDNHQTKGENQIDTLVVSSDAGQPYL